MMVLQVCAFAAESPGNFIATLTALENKLRANGVCTIYAFPQRASDKAWCKALCQRTKVYFLPEANARILPETYKIFKKIYSENNISIVHSHFELYDMPATLMATKKTKVFWHLHDPIGDEYEKSSLSRRILTRVQYGWAGKRATLLTVSEKHGAFAASIGFPKKQIKYFPNGINTNRIKQVPIRDGVEEKKLLLLGWDVYRKGVDVLVDTAKLLERSDYSVHVVGLERCQEYLKLNPQDTIHFLRPVTDINTLFEDSNAFLHISRAEGQSYALLEAIYAGIPVICSDIPENLFAKQFKNIYWVKTGDSTDLAEKMRVVLDEDKAPTEEDIRFNREIIDEKYSIHAWVKQTISFYLPHEE